MLSKICHAFTRELRGAEKGKATSLLFVKHKLPKHPFVRAGEFLVIKIGGSILQKSRIRVKNSEITMLSLEEKKLPTFSDLKMFLKVIDANIDRDISILALNFGYPLEPLFSRGLLDGVLLRGTKEHAFSGLVGKPVGKTIEQFLFTKYNHPLRVSVANDTICLALAGLTQNEPQELAGGVIGTGMNFAVFLDNTTVINLESANFNRLPQTIEGKEIDRQSISPGTHLFEKEVAGAYLHEHLNVIMKKRNIKHPIVPSTHALDTLARGNVTIVSEIARNLLTRSAQLVACQVAGIMNWKGRDMTFIMEGSLFWKAKNYRETVRKTVGKLSRFAVTFEEIPNCGIIGASKLVA